MHYPFSMAISDNTLVVSSQASDHKYGFGRLVAIDLNAVDQALAKDQSKAALPFNEIVTSNTRIARDAGLIAIDGQIVFGSRENNNLYAVPRDQNGFLCNDSEKKLESCPEASVLALAASDPYALEFISQGESENKILVTYLSSDRLDIVNLDKNKKNNALKPVKHFFAADWVREKLGEKALKDKRLITRKIFLANKADKDKAKVYFLFEKYSDKSSFIEHSKGVFIIAVLASQLISEKQVPASSIELWDLSEQYNIKGAQDLYVNDEGSLAYVLARLPESIFKIDLHDQKRFESQPVCLGASSLAVTAAQDRLFIPCYQDNKVISFKLPSLRLDNATGYYGRGPAFIAIDDNHKRIFVSYNNDNKVGILNFNLDYLGHIFNQASSHSTGS